MQVVLFSLYYCKLRLGAMLGVHRTANPLNLNWRWNYWQDKRQRRRNR